MTPFQNIINSKFLLNCVVLTFVEIHLNSLHSDECINNSDNQANALSLVDSLPDLNRELLIYLVKFLKVLSVLNLQQ